MIQRAYGVAATLAHGPAGSFDVLVGDEVVAGREGFWFPEDDEILDAVGEALGRKPAQS